MQSRLQDVEVSSFTPSNSSVCSYTGSPSTADLQQREGPRAIPYDLASALSPGSRGHIRHNQTLRWVGPLDAGDSPGEVRWDGASSAPPEPQRDDVRPIPETCPSGEDIPSRQPATFARGPRRNRVAWPCLPDSGQRPDSSPPAPATRRGAWARRTRRGCWLRCRDQHERPSGPRQGAALTKKRNSEHTSTVDLEIAGHRFTGEDDWLRRSERTADIGQF
jgi:hypothetical protein